MSSQPTPSRPQVRSHTLDLPVTVTGTEHGGTEMSTTTRRSWHPLTREEGGQRASRRRGRQRHHIEMELRHLQHLR